MKNADIIGARRVLERYDAPRTVADTDEGAAIRQRIGDLRRLQAAYEAGLIPEDE